LPPNLFSGIGVLICQIKDGAEVAEAKLQAKDIIIAVDGESLKGKSIEKSK